MQLILHILKWIFTIIILTMMVSFTNQKHAEEVYYLTDIDILSTGNHYFLNNNIIIESLKKYIFSRKHQINDDVSIGMLEDRLTTHPAVQNAEVFLIHPGDVNIKIQAREPVIRIHDINKDYYLDEYTKIMPLSKNYTARVIVATGETIEDNHENLIELSQSILTDSLLKYQITQIHINEHNDIILIPRIGGHKIIFGDFKNFNQKLENLSLFYKRKMSINGWGCYTDINLKFKNQIVCTKK
ncbi:MAG: hypothetical protein VX347_04100 [Bacteroidota bacterium]|nr:hypothetical protein [Bacteroidota bacterium]